MNKAAFEAKVLEILRENGNSRWRRHMDDGRLDVRSLHEYRTSDKVFKRREMPGRRDYAVAFVLDVSGSMRGPKSEAAMDMALQFAESMNALRIPFCITAFANRAAVIHGAGENYSRPLMRERLHALYFGYSVLVDRDTGETCSRDPSLGYRTLSDDEYRRGNETNKYMSIGAGTNPDVAFFKAALLVDRFPGEKIIVTMSDGEFNENWGPIPPRWARDVEKWSKLPGNSPKQASYRSFEAEEPESSYFSGMSTPMISFAGYMSAELGWKFLWMGIQQHDFELLEKAQPHLLGKGSAFTVHNLSQGYAAMLSKLETSFSFDHARKLR